MTPAIDSAFSIAPRPASARAAAPRDDERDFTRALRENEESEAARRADRPEEDEPVEEADEEPEDEPAAAAPRVETTVVALAALLAPTSTAATEAASAAIAAPAAQAATPADDATAAAEAAGPEAIVQPAGEAETPVAAAPEAQKEQAKAPAADSRAAAEIAAQAKSAAPEKPGDSLGKDGEESGEADSDLAWTPPGSGKPVVAGAQAPGQAAQTPQAQPTPVEGEQLAPVRVLRNVAGEALASEGKPAPSQAAPVSPAPASPSAAPLAAAFDAKLQSADAAAPPPAPTGQAPRAAPPPAMQVAVQVAQAVEDGVRRLEVKLHPAELGRVEVKLDVGHDGRVLAVVAADRQDTLDMLQKDARSLERALQDAGIRADSGSLSFTLRQQDQQARSGSMGGRSASRYGEPGDDAPAAAIEAARPRLNLRALDISV